PYSFSLLLPPPPTSTLFPYTTLFRSADFQSGVHDRTRVDLQHDSVLHKRPETRQCRFQLIGTGSKVRQNVASGFVCSCSANNTGDRKSTRLNSSHVAISYAVFCLKKK